MTDGRFTWLDTATVLVSAVILAAAVLVAFKGPAGPLPLHFDLNGHPNRWGDRTELAGTLALLAGLVGATAGGMSWYAARAEDPARRRSLRVGQLISLLVIAVVAAFLGGTVLGAGPTGTVGAHWVTSSLGLVMLVTGAFLGRVGPNPVIGVRTPWNFKSRLAWDRSNRLAGRLFFWLGMASLLAGPLLPPAIGMTSLTVAVLIAAAWSVFESWRVWRTDPDRQPF
jgi:uncharacterized membrane protein